MLRKERKSLQCCDVRGQELMPETKLSLSAALKAETQGMGQKDKMQ